MSKAKKNLNHSDETKKTAAVSEAEAKKTEVNEAEVQEAVEEVSEEMKTADQEAADENAAETSEQTETAEESDAVRARLDLEKKDAEIAAMKDRYMRVLAEYENYRKRTEKEKTDIYTFAVKDVMNKILPVLDNLQRGVAAIPEEAKEDSFAQGMDKIEKQFVKVLEDIGVKPIEAEGKPFDPNYHNAVMHVDNPELGDNVVAMELQKGYTYKDTVVRTSMVQVAN